MTQEIKNKAFLAIQLSHKLSEVVNLVVYQGASKEEFLDIAAHAWDTNNDAIADVTKAFEEEARLAELHKNDPQPGIGQVWECGGKEYEITAPHYSGSPRGQTGWECNNKVTSWFTHSDFKKDYMKFLRYVSSDATTPSK
jgi:hypothetical protein